MDSEVPLDWIPRRGNHFTGLIGVLAREALRSACDEKQPGIIVARILSDSLRNAAPISPRGHSEQEGHTPCDLV